MLGKSLRAGLAQLALLLLCGFALRAEAAARWAAERVVSGPVTVENVELRLRADSVAPSMAIHASAERIAVDALAEAWTQWQMDCTLTVESAADWRCKGSMQARAGLVLEPLAVEMGMRAGRFEVQFGAPRSQAVAALQIDIGLSRVPLGWLMPLLRTAIEQAKPGAGTVTAMLVGSAQAIRGSWLLDGVAVDTPQGSIAAQGLSAAGDLVWGSGADRSAVEVRGKLSRGEWLLAPLYVAIGEQPIEFALAAHRDGSDWQVDHWDWRDASLHAAGSATIGSGAGLTAVQVTGAEALLPLAYTRYFSALLAPYTLGELKTDGQIVASGSWSAAAGWSAQIDTGKLAAADNRGRFAVQDLSAHLALNMHGQSSRLGWNSASLYRVALGASTVNFSAAPDGWSLDEPWRLPMLGGSLNLEQLAFHPRASDAGRWQAALEIAGLDMKSLCQAFGWPEFGGSLSGRLPSISVEQGVVALDGGLTLKVFDGDIAASRLRLERPFGIAPSLSADLALDGLDLSQLTDAFSFGRIEGRLQGHIRGLRLVDWAPVAFDAQLRSDDNYRGKRRLSQRAVQGLSSVGGGAGIEASVYKLFQNFDYQRIGLACQLSNNVCAMGGIDSGPAGYTIIEGAGLPRLTVIGHSRRVDWPVLLARLKAATSGTAPIVK